MEHPEAQRSETASMEEAIGAIDPEEILRTTKSLTRENPHAAIAGAFAIGFLLGGGLTPRILFSIAALVGRRYAAEAAREALGTAVQRQMDEVAAH